MKLSASEVAEQIAQRLDNKIVMAIPLGAGKPNHLVNAIYDLAKKNSELELTIVTALTLNKPKGKSLLESRFLDPFAERVFGNYPNLQYELDRQKNKLPKNIRVVEFYFLAGKLIQNKEAQCNYISSNYTHVARDLTDFSVNLIAHMVAERENSDTFSLSCNADVTTDLLKMLKEKGQNYLLCAQVNQNLPFMYGEAELAKKEFDFVLEGHEVQYPVFAPPKVSVPLKDHLIGLYASTLVRDGGELQIGIGSLGDALVYSLLMRHQRNDTYLGLVESFQISNRFGQVIKSKGSLSPFASGLFAATEMLVDSFMYLIKAGILKRKVYDHVILQRLLNDGLISEEVTSQTLYLLLENRAINPKLTEKDFKFLKAFGIFKKETEFVEGYLLLPGGERIEADLNKDQNFQDILKYCLGERLANGAIVHGGFFLGCNEFYSWLRDMPENERRLIHMKPVSKINQLYGHEDIDRLHRRNARFVNTCLKMTLLGAAVSDGLEDGRVVSGVGGQYNFVSMAHALPDGHSILQLRSTREENGRLSSNIVFNYGHVTIPRHLRDIVITEYGIADIRGKSDSDVVAALIEIADSQFQSQLIRQAKAAGKLRENYRLPHWARANTEEKLKSLTKTFRQNGGFPSFPFGTELTETEIRLGKALKSLKKKQRSKKQLLELVGRALISPGDRQKFADELERMALVHPKTLEEKLYQKLLLVELNSV